MPVNPHHSPSPQEINNSRLFWVTPQSQLESVLTKSGARHLAVFTSEAASIIPPPVIAQADFLMLEFNDITAPQPGLVLPDLSHIDKLLEFATTLPKGAPLALSCYAGISRSTAAAYILACTSQPTQSEMDIAVKLRIAAPSATPNILMVSMADNLLGRNGRLVKAIETIGRGAEAYEGRPFQLDISARSDKIIHATENPLAPIGEQLP